MTAPVVVVGGSLTGALTALRLDELGVPSVVLESRLRPAAKVCGEGLHPAGLRAVEEVLGPVGDLGIPLHGFRFTDADRELLAMQHPVGHTGLGFDRLLLEQRLWDALGARPGIDFRTGETVRRVERLGESWRIGTGTGQYQAAFLVAADGVRSKVRSLTGRARGTDRGRWGLRQRWRHSGATPQVVEVCFLDDSEVFCTPLSAEVVSIAVLGKEALVRSLRQPEALDRYLARIRSGSMRRVFGAGSRDGPAQILPHRGRRTAVLCGDRLLFGGDAAVFLDPVSGAGMTLAALAARTLAGAVRDAVAGADPEGVLRRADRDLRRQVRPFRRLTRVLRLLGRSPLARRVAIPVLRRSPSLVRALARATVGGDAAGPPAEPMAYQMFS